MFSFRYNSKHYRHLITLALSLLWLGCFMWGRSPSTAHAVGNQGITAPGTQALQFLVEEFIFDKSNASKHILIYSVNPSELHHEGEKLDQQFCNSVSFTEFRDHNKIHINNGISYPNQAQYLESCHALTESFYNKSVSINNSVLTKLPEVDAIYPEEGTSHPNTSIAKHLPEVSGTPFLFWPH